MKTKLLLIGMLAIIGLSATAQWKQIGYGAQVRAIYTNGNTIYVGGPGVFYTPDYGNTWTSTYLNPGWPNPYVNVYSLALSGTQLAVGTDSRLFFSGKDFSGFYGDSWTNPYYSGMVNDAQINALLTSGSYIYAASQYGAYYSNDYGNTWNVGSGMNSTINKMYALAMSGNNIFAGGVGMFLSTNHGSSWNAIGNNLPTIYSLAISGTHIFAGTQNGVFLSTNNGGSWQAVNNGLNTGLLDTIVLSLAVNGNTVLAGTNNGVFYTTNYGNSWTAFSTGFSGYPYITALAVNGTYFIAGNSAANPYYGTYIRPLSDISGVQDISVTETMKVFPNPSTGIFQIQSDKMPIRSWEIYNVTGEIICSSKVNSEKIQIDLSGQPKGMYFYKIISEDDSISTGRLIVQ